MKRLLSIIFIFCLIDFFILNLKAEPPKAGVLSNQGTEKVPSKKTGVLSNQGTGDSQDKSSASPVDIKTLKEKIKRLKIRLNKLQREYQQLIKKEKKSPTKIEKAGGSIEPTCPPKDISAIPQPKKLEGIQAEINKIKLEIEEASIKKIEEEAKEEAKKELESMLHEVIKDNHFEIVKRLIEKAKININIKDNLGQTPLMQAALKNNAIILDYLVKNGADANIADEKGWTALHWAAWGGQLEAVGYLVNIKGIDINARTNPTFGSQGLTALELVEKIQNDAKANNQPVPSSYGMVANRIKWATGQTTLQRMLKKVTGYELK